MPSLLEKPEERLPDLTGRQSRRHTSCISSQSWKFCPRSPRRRTRRRPASSASGGLFSGVGLWLPEPFCAEDLRLGRIKKVLENWSSPETPVHAVYPSTRHQSPKVAAFVDLLRREFSPATATAAKWLRGSGR